MFNGLMGWAVSDAIRDFSFSLVFTDKPEWLRKVEQGVVLYRKPGRSQFLTLPKFDRKNLYRRMVDLRIDAGCLK